MLKYTTTQVTFLEIPDEITLCINISNCPIKCPDCHSKELWGDIGEILTEEKITSLIEKNEGISAICFMGGDGDFPELKKLVLFLKEKYKKNLKIAWYSGKNVIPLYFDYVKIGPYIKDKGGLDNPNTNQRLFRISDDFVEDITYKFWKNVEN